MQSEAPGIYRIQGRAVEMPVVVRDAGSANAMFLIDAARAQDLIPGNAFRIVEVAPGQAQIILGAIDYRDNDLGDYNEAAVIFFVRPADQPDAQPGTFIYKLPVDQSFTCEAGCGIWGFPKSVEKVDIRRGDDRVICRLEMGDRHVFTLGVRTDGSPAPSESAGDGGACTYTYIDGVAHRNRMTTAGDMRITPGADGVELELGDHPLARELQSLGLPKPALMSTWTEHMSGSFEDPQKL